MTVYTGDIKSAITFLSTTVGSVDDLERADALTRATVRKATNSLAGALATATATLDADVSLGGLAGAPIANGGDFPLDTAKALTAAIANSVQATSLQSCVSYVGRVALMLEELP